MPQQGESAQHGEITEPKAQEPVHSNTPEPKEKTPQEKEAARLAFERRQKQKQWQRTQSQMTQISDDDALAEVTQAAREAGLDPSDDKSKDNLKFIARGVTRVINAQNSANRDQVKKESSTILTQTMTELGIDPQSPQGRSFGNYLFQKHGFHNPDIFHDKEFLESEREELISSFSKKKSPITEALVNKGSAIQPNSESRTAEVTEVNKNQIKATATRYGVSEATAGTIKDLQSKINPRLRPPN